MLCRRATAQMARPAQPRRMLLLMQDPSRRLLKRAHEAKEATGQTQGGRTSGAKESTGESQKDSPQGDEEGSAQHEEAQGRP